MEYIGIQTQKSRNDFRSMLLLFMFPCLVIGLVYLFCVVMVKLGVAGNMETEGNLWSISGSVFLEAAPYAIGGIALWFVIAYFLNTLIIKASTGAKTLERKQNKRVYNLVENLCMSQGMKMPKINILYDNSLNAFASGINGRTYTVTLSQGIIEKLDDEELDAVIAHELTHIRNHDVRLLIVSIVFVGVFSMIAQIAFRSAINASCRSSGKDNNKGGTIIILLLAAVFAAVGYLLATLMRFAISRKREYLALYKNEVDCIIADQSYLGILETNHESFSDETRVVYQMEVEEKINTVTTKTDVTENSFIVYITGIDTYGSVNTISRADVNLLVCVNPVEKQILMVSIPRDTKVNLHMNGKMDKINHSAMYGINETIQTLEDFLDLKVNYYAKTNFSGVTNIIDALGGVTVNSDYAFTTLHGNYKIVKGKNQMDGDKALCFVRERYALPNGDFDRGKNQQKLLKAIIDKAISPKIITNYNNILSAVEGTFETDMASDDIKALINMQLDDMAEWDMFNVQVTGDPEYTYKTYSQKGQRTYVTAPDKDKLEDIKNVIDKVENGEKISSKDVKGLQ